MIKRPFFSLTKTRIEYPALKEPYEETAIEIPLPKRAALFLEDPGTALTDLHLKEGDRVRTGQRIKLFEGEQEHFVSTVTGTVFSIERQTGYLKQPYIEITIDVDDDEWDEEFNQEDQTLSLTLSGLPIFADLFEPQSSLKTIIICGIDREPLVRTNQITVLQEFELLKDGIDYLKGAVNGSRIILIVPAHIEFMGQQSGVEVQALNPLYPNALPELVVKAILGREVPAGKCPEDIGVKFVSADAVVKLAKALKDGEMPVHQRLTVIDKKGNTFLVKARIGTPVQDILENLQIETAHGDRLILGGPMSGKPILSEDFPVLQGTDAIMVQDRSEIILSTDTHCVNCGECVRACPAKIPVNMLVRLLENGLFEEAADQYDMLSCIECGLCSYVCTARIPIFHHITLGKYELLQIRTAEEANA